MVCLIFTFINLCVALQVFPNLGVVFSPQNNLFVFDAFATVQGKLIVEFPTINKFHNTFFTDCVNRSTINNTQKELNKKSNVKTLGSIFQGRVISKLFSYNRNFIMNFTTNDTEANSDVNGRARRQALEVAMVAVGALGSELIHTLFGSKSTLEVKTLKHQIETTEIIRSSQINKIAKSIESLHCEENAQIAHNHDALVSIIMDNELEHIGDILFSLHYRLGLNTKVFKLFRTACLIAVKNKALCELLLIKQKFVVNVIGIQTSFDKIEFNLSFVFPTNVRSRKSVDIFNYGVIVNGTEGLIGKRIKSIEGLTSILQPENIGFNKAFCTKLDTISLCSLEDITPNSVSKNNCLSSILNNNTNFCEIENFSINRPCLIHQIGNTPLISAAVSYKLLTTSTNGEGKVSIDSYKGQPGLYPVTSYSNEIDFITLICQNITKIMMLKPYVIQETTHIYLEPTMFFNETDTTFNLTIFLRDELKLNELVNTFLNSEIVANVTHKDIIYTSIIFLLFLICITFCKYSSKIKKCLTKGCDVEVA